MTDLRSYWRYLRAHGVALPTPREQQVRALLFAARFRRIVQHEHDRDARREEAARQCRLMLQRARELRGLA